MHTNGTHLIFDVWLKDELNDSCVESIFEVVREHFNVVEEHIRHFQPIGLTAVFILSESHFTLHTYPEHQYLSLDVYACDRENKIEGVLAALRNVLNIKHSVSRILPRGEMPGLSPTGRRSNARLDV